MRKYYVYKSVALHIAVVLLCVLDLPILNAKRQFDEQPPIIVNLEDVVITEKTNLPEKAIRGKEEKPATRKEAAKETNFSANKPVPEPEPAKNVLEKSEPLPEIKTPTLIEETPKFEEKISEEPVKETKKAPKEKKKPAPIPQKKPQIKPVKKPEPKKKTESPKKPEPQKQSTPKKADKPVVKAANPLASLMNSVDDLQKQIGEENKPAEIPAESPVNNLGIEGGNNRGSYFSELSVSGLDFVRSKIQDSWKTTVGGKDDRNIEVVIVVKLTKDGNIQSVDIEDKIRYRTDTYFQALADSAERAIRIAQEIHNVFKVLASQNASSFNDWKSIRFTFTPLGLSR